MENNLDSTSTNVGFIKSCDNCISTHSWNGCGMFGVKNCCESWKDMFDIGTGVELTNKEFELQLKGEPTGIFATGRIINKITDDLFTIKLYCNDKKYDIARDSLKLLD